VTVSPRTQIFEYLDAPKRAAEQLERVIARLDSNSLDHLASNMHERAALRRVPISPEEAREAIDAAPLTPGWQSSCMPEVGRVRVATRILIERGYHPTQIAEAMCAAALPLMPHPSIAPEAVAAGIADALEGQ
jgi:hypothetical protein